MSPASSPRSMPSEPKGTPDRVRPGRLSPAARLRLQQILGGVLVGLVLMLLVNYARQGQWYAVVLLPVFGLLGLLTARRRRR